MVDPCDPLPQASHWSLALALLGPPRLSDTPSPTAWDHRSHGLFGGSSVLKPGIHQATRLFAGQRPASIRWHNGIMQVGSIGSYDYEGDLHRMMSGDPVENNEVSYSFADQTEAGRVSRQLRRSVKQRGLPIDVRKVGTQVFLWRRLSPEQKLEAMERAVRKL